METIEMAIIRKRNGVFFSSRERAEWEAQEVAEKAQLQLLLRKRNTMYFGSKYDIRKERKWNVIEGTNEALRQVMTGMFSGRCDTVFRFKDEPPFLNINAWEK